MPVLYQCACGETIEFDAIQGGELSQCHDCERSFVVPYGAENDLGESDGIVGCPRCGAWTDRFGGPPQCLTCGWSGVKAVPGGEPDATVDALDESEVRFGPVLLLLAFFGPLGVVLGYAAGGASVGVAIGINVFHNVLPRFYFILPLFIVLFMAIAPAVYGWVLGWVVGNGAQLSGHRDSTSAGLVAVLWALIGIVAFPYVANGWVPQGQDFFGDVLMPFVELMIGGCVSFEWLDKPKPVDVSPKIVYTVLGVSTLLGLMMAFGQSDEEASNQPAPAIDA